MVLKLDPSAASGREHLDGAFVGERARAADHRAAGHAQGDACVDRQIRELTHARNCHGVPVRVGVHDHGVSGAVAVNAQRSAPSLPFMPSTPSVPGVPAGPSGPLPQPTTDSTKTNPKYDFLIISSFTRPAKPRST
jgi:hypothetical protein